MTDALHAVLHFNSDDVALAIRPAPDADRPAVIREEIRAWASVHAHYFGPEIIARAAELITDNGINPAGVYLVRRDTLLAYLHLAAQH